MSQQARRNAGYAAIAGLVLLAYGLVTTPVFHVDEVSGTEEGYELFNASLHVFYAMLRFGGGALILTAGLCFAGIRFGILVSGVITGLCGLIMLACGGYWVSIDGWVLSDILYLLFGFIFVRDAYLTLSLFRMGEPVPAQAATPVYDEPPHPAGVHPESLPRDGEPPPADGYLAALSKEDEEPPTASHK